MRANLDGDIVVGLVDGVSGGDADVPVALRSLPIDRLRFDGSAIIDAATLTQFYVDPQGRKHVRAASGRVSVTCAWDDELIADDSAGWRAPTAGDQLRAYASDVRWRVEVGGANMTLGDGSTMRVPTTREGRAALKQARDMLADGELLAPDGTTLSEMDVTISNVSMRVDEATATAILRRAGQHVQHAFSVEATVYQAITAGTITTTAQIDTQFAAI